MGTLINRILGECLLISSLLGSALRMYVESAITASRFNKRSRSLDGKLDIKIHSPCILYPYSLVPLSNLAVVIQVGITNN